MMIGVRIASDSTVSDGSCGGELGMRLGADMVLASYSV